MLLLLAGCGLIATKDAGSFDELGDDIADTVWGPTDTGWSSCSSGGREFAWVASELVVGPPDVGIDLTGDGVPDNALSILAASLNDILYEELRSGSVALVLQFWGLDDWCDDPSFFGGLVVAQDTDGDPTDNFLGGEVFRVDDGLDGSGHAELSAEATMADSLYSVWIPGASVEIAGIQMEAATSIVLEGGATPTANTGVFGFAMSVASLAPYAEENGVDVEVLDALADVDSDGNGSLDALSIAFVFNAVACQIE